jgi:hypothetical protein
MEFTLEMKVDGQYVIHKFTADDPDQIMQEVVQFMKMIGINNVELETVIMDSSKIGLS